MGMAELYRELPWQHAGARKNGGKHFRKVGDFQRKCLTISDIIIMISDMKTTQIAHKIAQLKQELAELGPMHPGSLSEQYNVCGKRSEEHTSELQSHSDLVCRLLLEKKK